MKIEKPVLMVGMGISLLVVLEGGLSHLWTGVGNWVVLSLITLGGIFWLKKRYFKLDPPVKPSYQARGEVQVREKITQTEALLTTLEAEVSPEILFPLQEQLKTISQALNRLVLQVALTGGQKVGKSLLRTALEAGKINQQINWLETEPLLLDSQRDQKIINYLSLTSDLTLFLITGDLTESEWAIIQQLLVKEVPLILVFNKQDQYLPEEKVLILKKLEQHLGNILSPANIIGISAITVHQKVRQIKIDGSSQERIDYLEEEIKPLEIRLKQRLELEGQELIWRNIWRQLVDLKQSAKNQLNQVRRERALPIIEKYQWLVALAVFANPIPAVDCLVNATFSTQMIVEINEIYQQKLKPKHIKIILVTLGELIVKLGLVELTTQSIISLLKTNTVTYIAGGTIQAISAAYWTGIAGSSMIEYLQEQLEPLSEESVLDLERLKDKFNQIWQKMQKKELLSNLVKQSISRLSPN